MRLRRVVETRLCLWKLSTAVMETEVKRDARLQDDYKKFLFYKTLHRFSHGQEAEVR